MKHPSFTVGLNTMKSFIGNIIVALYYNCSCVVLCITVLFNVVSLEHYSGVMVENDILIYFIYAKVEPALKQKCSVETCLYFEWN